VEELTLILEEYDLFLPDGNELPWRLLFLSCRGAYALQDVLPGVVGQGPGSEFETGSVDPEGYKRWLDPASSLWATFMKSQEESFC
jgi:hypothetical protein